MKWWIELIAVAAGVAALSMLALWLLGSTTAKAQQPTERDFIREQLNCPYGYICYPRPDGKVVMVPSQPGPPQYSPPRQTTCWRMGITVQCRSN